MNWIIKSAIVLLDFATVILSYNKAKHHSAQYTFICVIIYLICIKKKIQ
jgi:hypothetical protein